ncbi:uncharacterized protein LOC131630417 [Vicia villosa]|uniref:uncharacterized protein LOC131630417 n=1 Tax=Vicia villosa TaxID=3911 RepID=UPI00273CAA93|nr:uncharacterized protein LOC131630417 [Vicia villosa]
MWTLNNSCKDIISDCWSNVIVGCPMWILSKKLQNLKAKLKQLGPSLLLREQEKAAHDDLEVYLKQEELFWAEKENLEWHSDGDRNTTYFHRIAKMKTSNQAITLLMDGDTSVTDKAAMANLAVSHFTNLFCFAGTQQNLNIVGDVIPNLVTEDMNKILTALPSHEEIRSAVFGLNKQSSPGPGGFGGFFYQTYWSIIKDDVCAAVLQFFQHGEFISNFNVSKIILIPKSPEAQSMDMYRPIALSNFNAKIISKIIATMLSSMMPSLISKEQRGFIPGRHIKDCICIASKAVNVLDTNSTFGNVAMKVDISKAFDTISWDFIMQGDPLSPIIFVLAQDVLSRLITSHVSKDSICLIRASVDNWVPSHSMYADDIMVFCSGRCSNINSMKTIFHNYVVASGQHVNLAKSYIFMGGMSNSAKASILADTGFQLGSLPFFHLGAPLFKGRVKNCHIAPIIDRITAKLACWKGNCLSMAGRLVLIKAIVHSMALYTISICNWPSTVIKLLEKACRNFLWSGSTSTKKMCLVLWKKICQPFNHGGLGIHSFCCLNEATNMKMMFDILNSKEDWVVLIKNRVLRSYGCIRYHIFSSIWTSVKAEFGTVITNSRWDLGSGKNVMFWTDSWCGALLLKDTNIDALTGNGIDPLIKVSDLSSNGQWYIPHNWFTWFPFLSSRLLHFKAPSMDADDSMGWKHSMTGVLELKEVYRFKVKLLAVVPWCKAVWNISIPPSRSILVWRMLHDWLNLFHHNKSPQFALVHCAAVVNLLYIIWQTRNAARHNNIKPNYGYATDWILRKVRLSGNSSKKASFINMMDFTLIKEIKVNIIPPKAPSILEVIWAPPNFGWFKCNCDGSFIHDSSKVGGAGLFRNYKGDFILSFAENLRCNSSVHAEFGAVIRAMEIAIDRGWQKLWIETDSSMVVKAFSNHCLVPFSFRTRWNYCLQNANFSHIFISHIYREGNSCADFLANLALGIESIALFDSIPLRIRNDFVKNRLGIPFFRFV